MTREQAIKVLEEWAGHGPISGGVCSVFFNATLDEVNDALDMAIAALRERDILWEQVRGYCHTCKKNKTDFDCHTKCCGHQRGSAWEWDGGRRLEEV